MNIEIKEAMPFDVGRLGTLGGAFIGRSISRNFISFDEEGFVNNLFTMLSLGVLKIWIAKDGNSIAGALGLILSQNIYNPSELLADIYFVDVLPEYQKQGIALKLIWAAEEWSKAAKVKALTISFKNIGIAQSMQDEHGWIMLEYKLIKKGVD